MLGCKITIAVLGRTAIFCQTGTSRTLDSAPGKIPEAIAVELVAAESNHDASPGEISTACRPQNYVAAPSPPPQGHASCAYHRPADALFVKCGHASPWIHQVNQLHSRIQPRGNRSCSCCCPRQCVSSIVSRYAGYIPYYPPTDTNTAHRHR